MSFLPREEAPHDTHTVIFSLMADDDDADTAPRTRYYIITGEWGSNSFFRTSTALQPMSHHVVEQHMTQSIGPRGDHHVVYAFETTCQTHAEISAILRRPAKETVDGIQIRRLHVQ